MGTGSTKGRADMGLRLDADPAEAALAQETRADHERAKDRGERLRILADGIVSELNAEGLLRPGHARARRLIFHQLADELYGNQAIDGPSTAWRGWS
jgi:hypothetical protein